MTRLALALGLLALLVPAGGLAHVHRPAPHRETSIFYYPWYGSPKFDGAYLHWDQNGHVPPLDLATSYYPARGPYSSADPKVVAAQMREIAGAGIQEVVSSWWGTGSLEDQRLPMIMRMAAKQDLKVAVQIEPYEGRSGDTVAGDLVRLRQLGVTRFYVYHPFEIADASWTSLLSSVSGVQVLAQTANVARAQAARFAGVYTYDVATFGPASLGPLCARAHRAGLLCAPSVGPGYDALRATGDTHVRNRDGGSTYDAMWKAAINAGADRVTITSYNEWHEGTQIEPALTRLPRILAVAGRPATSPVREPYSSYDGAYGLHGKQASRAYLVRTTYWARLYRGEPVAATWYGAAQKAAAQGRKGSFRAERGQMLAKLDGPCNTASRRSKGSVHAAFRASRSNLLLHGMPSRLMAAVRVTGSDTVVRPPGRAALRTTRGTRERSCYRARRPLALLGMSVITRCASSSGDSRSTAPDVLPAGQVRIGGKLDVRKGGDELQGRVCCSAV